ncbi:MAG: response regulator [Candidatus Syntrophosphaera sp.]|nr:response regulator [Candidatus Syntrophosphaera sp.]
MPAKVLIVDGDELTRETVGDWLEEKGYEAEYVADLPGAEAAAGACSYDVVIADIQWPGQQGVERIEGLKRLFPKAPVIAISTFADFELEQEARQHGAYTCISKPIQVENLLQVLSAALNTGPSRENTEFLPGKLIEQILLRGFTQDQQWEFRQTGILRSYERGDLIQFTDEQTSMIWVEVGRLDAMYDQALVDTLGEGDFWGEETFVYPNAVFTHLVALEETQLRHFSRKRIWEFFAYQDETLTKRFMINLIHCLHIKWKRTAMRLFLSGGAGSTQEEQEL